MLEKCRKLPLTIDEDNKALRHFQRNKYQGNDLTRKPQQNRLVCCMLMSIKILLDLFTDQFSLITQYQCFQIYGELLSVFNFKSENFYLKCFLLDTVRFKKL